jgi:pilus assembly protein Flp/PilA
LSGKAAATTVKLFLLFTISVQPIINYRSNITLPLSMGTDDRGTKMKQLLQRLRRDNRGATALEYGMIISLIVIAAVPAMSSVADETIAMWGDVETTMSAP